MSREDIKAAITSPLRDAGVLRAGLFGSTARNENTDASDVDVLVECPKGMRFLDLIALKQSLEERLGKTVDLVEYDALKPQLRDSIMRDYLPVL